MAIIITYAPSTLVLNFTDRILREDTHIRMVIRMNIPIRRPNIILKKRLITAIVTDTVTTKRALLFKKHLL